MSSNKKSLTPGEVREVGEAAWLLAQEYAEKNGLGVTKNGKSGHLVTVKGGVSKFIKDASDELSLSAFVKGKDNKWERERIRNFLKEGFNVVALHPGEHKYEWRIFVADEWTKNGTIAQPPVILSRKVSADVDRLTDGESGPVTETNLWEEFQNKPLSEKQVTILKGLYENGGKYHDPKGFGTPEAFGVREASSTVSHLEDRGLIVVTKKHLRAFKTIALTQKGWWAAERVDYLTSAKSALEAFIQKVGSFEGESKNFMNDLASRIHKTSVSTSEAVRELADEGKIKTLRNTPGDPNSPYVMVAWTGDPAPKEEAPGRATSTPTGRDTSTPTVAPDPSPAPARADRVRPAVVTQEQVQDVIDLLVKAAEGGASKQDLDVATTALTVIHRMCKDVEAGNLSALRAVVEIEEAARNVLENG